MSGPKTPRATYYNIKTPELPSTDPDKNNPALASADPYLPYDHALAGFAIPKVERLNYPEWGEDFSKVTHFYLKVYYIEQVKILASASILYNFHTPFPFWHFLGRIVSRAFLGREDQLQIVQASHDGSREYVAFATRFYTENEEAGKVKALEVSLGWEDGHNRKVEHIRAFWKPARKDIVDLIDRVVKQQRERRSAATHVTLPETLTPGPKREPEEEEDKAYNSDASGEAVIGFQDFVKEPRKRLLGVSGKSMYHEVYFSPLETRFIPLVEGMPRGDLGDVN